MEKYVITFLVIVNVILIFRLIRLTMLLNTYQVVMENLSKEVKKRSKNGIR